VGDTSTYHIRGKHGWGVFFINEKLGMFSCVTDFGNFGHYWNAPGIRGLKSLLIGCAEDPSYFVNKVTGGARDFRHEKTIIKIKQKIFLERQERRSLSKGEARKLYNEAEQLEYSLTSEAYHYHLKGTELLDYLLSDGNCSALDVQELPQQAMAMFKYLFLPLVEILKAESDMHERLQTV